jgi:anthranilate phosphoribosyltransferase
MSDKLKNLIPIAFSGNLTRQDTSEALEIIMSGEALEGQIAAFLIALQKSGVNSEHILGAMEVMHKKMIPVEIPEGSIDTCGTGGDGKSSLNVSTAISFVLAANNLTVAKHGNKALTSKCGSADVLSALGININISTKLIEECLEKVGICFMFAPNHHPAMKHVGPVRQQIGVRTIFNMLGPLLNPGNVDNQIIGVFSKDVLNIYKDVFDKRDGKNAFIIHGYEGMDEISTEGENLIYSKEYGEIIFDPDGLNINRPVESEMIGDKPSYNANRIIDIFTGKKDSFYEIVCINAAFALLLESNKEPNKKNISEYYELSKSIIDSGAAEKKLKDLISFSNQ